MTTKVNIKKYLSLVIDVFIIAWVLNSVTKSESTTVFFIVFLFFFIIVFLIFKNKDDNPKLYKVASWEQVYYIIGFILIFINSSYSEIFFKNISSLDDWKMIINTNFLGLGAFVLFLRVRSLFKKRKS